MSQEDGSDNLLLPPAFPPTSKTFSLGSLMASPGLVDITVNLGPLRAGLGKGRGCHLWLQNRHFPSRAHPLTQGLCPLWWKAPWFGAVSMVTRSRPSLAVSVPRPPPLGPEVSRPRPGPACSGFLVDLQPLRPHSSPCHPCVAATSSH